MKMESFQIGACLAVLLSGLALFAGLLALPVVFKSISDLENELQEHMQEYNGMTQQMWKDLMEQKRPLISKIRRQINDDKCLDGQDPLRQPDGQPVRCQGGTGCPSNYKCTDSEIPFFRICCPPKRDAFVQTGEAACNCLARPNSCPPGPPGRPGRPGLPGTDGENGRRGQNGLKGGEGIAPDPSVCPPCPAGRPGPRGSPGSPGSPGRKGPNGSGGNGAQRGRPGPAGPAGDNGTPGGNGSPGRPGPDGRDGQSGGTGRPGPKGPSGRPGSPGPRGRPGTPGPDGTAPVGGGAPGPSGPPGSPGSRGPAGPPGPAGGPGNDAQYCPCPPRTEGAGVLSARSVVRNNGPGPSFNPEYNRRFTFGRNNRGRLVLRNSA